MFVARLLYRLSQPKYATYSLGRMVPAQAFRFGDSSLFTGLSVSEVASHP